jgi:DMSO/TMAO reductase YedYZ molybdopterin-dependent catalytic subunit
MTPMNRRRFFTLGAGSVAATALGACGSFGPKSAASLLRFAERKNEQLERWLFQSGSRNRFGSSDRLSGRAFPQYFVSDTIPMWNEAQRGVWRLEVGGAVRTPLSLSVDDLMKMRSVSQRVDHFCVEGWTARAEWTGVRLSELARAAGATSDAQYVDFQSFDSDYHESWDIDSALHPQTLVAYGMDRAMLGPGHGAPARVHSPVKLGYKNTKYLTRVLFMPTRSGGYWSDRGYEWYGGV